MSITGKTEVTFRQSNVTVVPLRNRNIQNINVNLIDQIMMKNGEVSPFENENPFFRESLQGSGLFGETKIPQLPEDTDESPEIADKIGNLNMELNQLHHLMVVSKKKQHDYIDNYKILSQLAQS